MGTPSHEDTGQNHNLEIEMDGKSHPENVLSSDALQYGYKESMEGMGISESKEVELSLAHRTDLWKGTCMRTFQQEVWQHLHAVHGRQQTAQVSSQASPHASQAGRLAAMHAAHSMPVALLPQAGAETLQQWVQELAGDRPLGELLQLGIPTDHPILDTLVQHQVPLHRATWFIHIHYAHRALQQHKGVKGAASQLWTLDLLTVLESTLRHPLPHDHACNSPPAPATPPQEGAEEFAEGSSFEGAPQPWCPPEEVPWMIPDPAAAFGHEAACRWHYYLAMSAHCHREGLMDAHALVTWLLQQMDIPQHSCTVKACLLPLLQLCIKDVAASQRQVRHLLDICSRVCGAEHGGAPAAQATSSGSACLHQDVRAALALALRAVVQHAPQVLPGLDLGPASQALAATACIKAPAGSTLSAASAEQCVQAACTKASRLSSDVNARVLTYDAAEAVQVLERAVQAASARAAVQGLQACLAQGAAAASVPALIVDMVCEWACTSNLPQLHDLGMQQFAPWVDPVKRIFTVDILHYLSGSLLQEHKHWQGEPQPASFAMRGTAIAPAVQVAVAGWLDKVTPGQTDAACALVVDLAVSGLLCPGQYLATLVAKGAVLCPSSGEGLQPSKHSTFLSQLHPQLPLPTLEARTASSSSGGQPAHETLLGPSAARSPPLPHTWSLARLQYAAARTAVLHGPGTANAQQTMPSSTGHAARQLLSRSGRSSQLDRDAASVKRPKLEHTGSQGPEMAPGISMKQEAVDSGSSGPASQEGKGLLAVQTFVEASLWVSSAPMTSNRMRDLVDAVAGLRVWEQRCFARWLSAGMHDRMCTSEGRPGSEHGGARLLTGLALLQTAGGLVEAAMLLVTMEAKLLSMRTLHTHGLQPGMIVLDTYTEQTGISEHILLALLAVRIPAIGMGGRLYQALEALSAWAFSAAAAKLSCAVGLKQFGEVTQLLSAVLTTYRANDGVARWWRTVNRQHPQHWLTQKLADDIASSPSLGGERQSVLLLPRTAGPRAGLSREPTEAGALQQLTAICNSFATVATSDQVCGACTRAVGCIMGARSSGSSTVALSLHPGLYCFGLALVASALETATSAAATGNPDNQHGFEALWDQHMHCMAAVTTMLYRQGCVQVMAALQQGLISVFSALEKSGADNNRGALLSVLIVRGFVSLEAACKALIIDAPDLGGLQCWAPVLLGVPQKQDVQGIALQTRLELNLHQGHLCQSTAVRAVTSIISACTGGGANLSTFAPETLSLLQHAPLCCSLVANSRNVYNLLLQDAKCDASFYMPAVVVCSIARGTLEGTDGAAQRGRVPLVARLLEEVTTANAHTTWLLLRVLLDEQVATAALARGMTLQRAHEAGAGAYAQAQTGMNSISEAEKTFTSQVLAALLVCPNKGGLLGRLAWALGRGIGEYLLQQAQWVLQDYASLLGVTCMADVLRKRCAAVLSMPTPDTHAGLPLPQQGQQLPTESGFCDLALSVLALSTPACQRETAHQIISQLERLGTALESSNASTLDTGPSKEVVRVSEDSTAVSSAVAAGGFGAGRARRMQGQAGSSKQAVGSAEGVQAAVWVRLKLLLPLLPLVYADPEPDSNKNMRVLLAKALMPVMASPLVYQHLRLGESGSSPLAFQQALSQSLLSVWQALIGQTWAPWLLGRQKGLREVGPIPAAAQLQQQVAGMGAEPGVLADMLSAF